MANINFPNGVTEVIMFSLSMRRFSESQRDSRGGNFDSESLSLGFMCESSPQELCVNIGSHSQ